MQAVPSRAEGRRIAQVLVPKHFVQNHISM